ncbi:MAG: 16S rRNA (cytidine(1402)-2'-O)-methyltransferase [Porphyromonas sp.]|uniref:16S rRNA (cytidine(1402)-2'-O)-methyltransferase n=1 Tax=Porphyromonas sp. TaxID=1924944 RepID=UPI002A913822|nr:16S rRNA (cytidine(1402)-2'-O)-methyltransferase [Porphyromonas sp.]MDD7469070.1 16S rRNA (cytidine(1402)-2'-O)-methyltransferase [Bacteroidales bacterium]MDY6102560.1 16S rRNA (cytidine(1402)-2'-O)-methyltransferase [Porphyromonas sp.]
MSTPLTIIPTPVGNLEDMTYRAVRLLREADLILAEDTRTSATLLREYGIETPMISYHIFNEHKIVERVTEEISKGRRVCLISDAGTPGISDPGFLLVRSCVEAGIEVSCLPGATAVIPAVVASGLPCDRFVFEGFLPHKKGRLTRLRALEQREETTIFYEAPTRIVRLLEEIGELYGDTRRVVLAREISKRYEEYLRGIPSELLQHFATEDPKGEMVLVVEGLPKGEKVHKNKFR